MLGVLEGVLSKRDWLVGGKYTIADISFVPYVSSRDEVRQHGVADRWGVVTP